MEKTRITSIQLFNNSIENFKKVIFSKRAAVALSIGFLTGCGTVNANNDKTAPVINAVEVVAETITVTATDEKGVTAYIVTTSSTKPSLDDKAWSTSSVFNVEEAGTYYVWVKDAADNISQSKTATVEKVSALDRLAKDFDHLAWIIAPDTAETKALKEKYGDLYAMVEPLTEQQIKDRWVYLVNYLVKENNATNDAYNGGLYVSMLGNDFYQEVRAFRNEYLKSMYQNKDPKLAVFSDKYLLVSGEYVSKRPATINSSETRFRVGLDIIDKVPLKDMEWFVRFYMVEAYKTIKMAQEKGLELNFYFDPQFSKTK